MYLNVTGSILKKHKGSPPVYVFELVVRNPQKQKSPIAFATFVTCNHQTASVMSFLLAFLTNVEKRFGSIRLRHPLMLICDGSLVLMQSICLAFAKCSLNDIIDHYYNIATGNGTKKDLQVPVLHCCQSHFMKNAKDICRKL